MADEKKCRKCGKKEIDCPTPFLTPYGFCNDCHYIFMEKYISPAIQKFIKVNRKVRLK